MIYITSVIKNQALSLRNFWVNIFHGKGANIMLRFKKSSITEVTEVYNFNTRRVLIADRSMRKAPKTLNKFSSSFGAVF